MQDSQLRHGLDGLKGRVMVHPESTKRLITTKQAAERTGYTSDHISLLLRRKLVNGEKIGRDWLIDESSLIRYVKGKPKPGPKGR